MFLRDDAAVLNLCMRYIKKIIAFLLKVLLAVVLMALMAVVVTSVSPVYDFEQPRPFCGPDIFNPYSTLDTTARWKKANFHVHTRVEGIFNECEYWPGEVYDALARLGYDIVTFSNHNELTIHPFDSTLQVNVYEHGYNLFKFHKLVFGSKDVNRYDNLLPLFASQKQFQFDILRKESDIIQYNHPLRTKGTSKEHMEKLSGYDIMELDCGKSTENEFWDWALSAGHYSYGLANDDLHFPDRSVKIARRCNFVSVAGATYSDIKNALLGGCYYSMRIPDYGKGNWEVKIEKNKNLPFVKNIGVDSGRIFINLSQLADSIKIFGQGHATLARFTNCSGADYIFMPDDTYARFTVYFPGGEVVYSNPFARYDASKEVSPFRVPSHTVNITLTILFNALLLALLAGLALMFYKFIIRKR